MLQGRLVNLRAVEPADYGLLWRWLNDSDLMYYWGLPGNTPSLTDVERDERAQAARGTSQKFIIETKESKPIGQVDYYDLNWRYRTAWTSIMIADRDFWGGGYGTDAMRTLLRYLFRQLELHRVSLTVHETNARAQRSYAKNGFVLEGVMRDWAFFNGSRVNGVIMAVLVHEFPDD